MAVNPPPPVSSKFLAISPVYNAATSRARDSIQEYFGVQRAAEVAKAGLRRRTENITKQLVGDNLRRMVLKTYAGPSDAELAEAFKQARLDDDYFIKNAPTPELRRLLAAKFQVAGVAMPAELKQYEKESRSTQSAKEESVARYQNYLTETNKIVGRYSAGNPADIDYIQLVKVLEKLAKQALEDPVLKAEEQTVLITKIEDMINRADAQAAANGFGLADEMSAGRKSTRRGSNVFNPAEMAAAAAAAAGAPGTPPRGAGGAGGAGRGSASPAGDLAGAAAGGGGRVLPVPTGRFAPAGTDRIAELTGMTERQFSTAWLAAGLRVQDLTATRNAGRTPEQLAKIVVRARR